MVTRLSPEEYLRIERQDEWKNEYVDGEMVEVPHPSFTHVLINTNLACELGNALRQSPCIVFASRLRVSTDPHRYYTYPDVVVTCQPLQFVDDERETISNPTFIAEVLSPATAGYDRCVKFERYRTIPTFAEYLLVAQSRVHLELYTRQADGVWNLREWNDPAAEIELVSLGCRLKAAEVYANVTFDDPSS